MADRPMIFSAPMVKALLAGRKTQTRRVLKPPYGTLEYLRDGTWRPICTKMFPGDRIWVREAWGWSIYASMSPSSKYRQFLNYRADEDEDGDAFVSRWCSPIHMPRWASRITLTVTDVRVQRVQGISSADAIAEGCPAYANSLTIDCDTPNPRDDYRSLWNSIHGPGAWDRNPWVVAYTFERVAP